MIHARWNLLRFRRLEAVAFDRMLESEYGPSGPDRRLLNTIEKPGNILDKLQKMAAAAERAYARAVRDLAQLRAKAEKSEKQNKAKAADEWLQAELARLENEPLDDGYIRFGTTRPADSSHPEPATHDPDPRR